MKYNGLHVRDWPRDASGPRLRWFAKRLHDRKRQCSVVLPELPLQSCQVHPEVVGVEKPGLRLPQRPVTRTNDDQYTLIYLRTSWLVLANILEFLLILHTKQKEVAAIRRYHFVRIPLQGTEQTRGGGDRRLPAGAGSESAEKTKATGAESASRPDESHQQHSRTQQTCELLWETAQPEPANTKEMPCDVSTSNTNTCSCTCSVNLPEVATSHSFRGQRYARSVQR